MQDTISGEPKSRTKGNREMTRREAAQITPDGAAEKVAASGFPQKVLVLAAAPGAEIESAPMAPCSAAIPAIFFLAEPNRKPQREATAAAVDNETPLVFPDRITEVPFSSYRWASIP